MYVGFVCMCVYVVLLNTRNLKDHFYKDFTCVHGMR